MKLRMLIMLIAVGIVLGGIFGFKIFQGVMIKKYMSAPPPPVTVSTATVELLDWQPKLEAVGSLRAVNGADLSPEVAGIVQTLNFESGSNVEKDAVLVQLRADDDMARLQALEATAKLADITYQRDLKQLRSKAVSQATVDADLASLESARAQVAQQQAILDKKTVKAPFAGRLGLRQVDIGQYIGPGTTVVTLQQLDPIYIDFTLPERSLMELAVGRKIQARNDAHPGTVFEGEVTSVNSKIDESTRNIQVRATLKNPEHKLLPGMFASIEIESGTPEKRVTLPQTAITYNPYGNTVYLVDSSSSPPTVKQTFVTLGDTRGDQVVALSGVKEGDVVVSAGQLKLRNGSTITVNNEIRPSNDPDPQPQDR